MTAATLPPPYRRVVAIAGLSNLADGIRMAAFPLLAFSVSSSEAVVAVVVAAGELPGLLLGLWAGGLADRVDRRRLLQRVSALRVVLLLALAALVVLDAVSIVLVVAAAFVLGASEVLADNTTGVLVPALVPHDDLERANSRFVGAKIIGNELVGPAAGGVLFAAGAAVPFLTNAGLLAVVLLILAGLPMVAGLAAPTTSHDDPPRHLDTLRAVWANPILRTTSWTSALLAAADAAWFALLVVFVGDELGAGSAAFGLFLAVGAIGGLGGVAIANRWPTAPLVAVVSAVHGSMAACLLALGVVPTIPFTIAALVVTSAGFALWNVFVASVRQRATPSESYGRVEGTYRTVVVGAALAGTLAGGAVAQFTSVRVLLVSCGCLVAAATPFAVAGFRRALRAPDEPGDGCPRT